MPKATTPKKEKSVPNLKFVDKYGVSLASTYDADPEQLLIPPPGHALYDEDGNTTFDEVRVQEIDRVGKCVRIVTVWSDKDANKLYVIAGRGNRFDVCEVNRRRKVRGDVPMKIGFLRFPGSLDEAVDFVRMENFRRKRPTASHLAREIVRLSKLGRPWGRIAEVLQLDGESEKQLRARAPLAHCIPEVAAAFDASEFPLRFAKHFGGTKINSDDKRVKLVNHLVEKRGTEALSRDEQLALLEERRKNKVKPPSEGGDDSETVTKVRPLIPTRQRTTVAERLANRHVNHLKGVDVDGARLIAAYERFAAGDAGALDYVPAIKAVIEGVLAEGKKPKATATAEAA